MGRVIIEIATLHGGRPRFESFDSAVSIGRAYDNDLVLADRTVSPHHLRVRELPPEELAPTGEAQTPEENLIHFEVEDLGSENGVRHSWRTVRGDRFRIGVGDELVVGRTRLRLFTPKHPVAATESLRAGVALFEPNRPVIAWATVVLGALAMTLLALVSSDGYETGQTMLFAVIGTVVVAIGWAAVWALVGRVLRHRPAFSAHAAVATAALVLAATADELAGWLGFAVPRIWIAPLFTSSAIFAVAVVTVVWSLELATNLRTVTRWVSGFAIATLVAAGTLYSLITPLIDMPYPVYPSQLRPVPAALVPTMEVDEFLSESDRVFDP